MPSTVVLLSFLFFPALSEDLGKESCGRKVEPVEGMGRSQRDGGPGQGIPCPQHPQLPEVLQDKPSTGAWQSSERHQQLPNRCAV